MEVPNCCCLLILLYGLVSLATSEKQTCGPGIEALGFTIPRGDIHILHGQPLDIYCTLDMEKVNESGKSYNSSSIFFSYDKDPVENAYVSIINKTTARLYIASPPRWKKMIQCHLRKDDGSSSLVCLNLAMVGDKPFDLQNFTCISHNWENLNCSWSVPQNYIPTTYEVSFALKKTNYKYHFMCPGPTQKNYCFWNASTDPTYRIAYSFYYFLIRGKNMYGEMSQNITLNHYASVKPDKPNLTVVQSTSDSISIKWGLPIPMYNFPTHLVHQIMYQSEYDNTDTWKKIFIEASGKNISLSYNITGLKYAHALYDIRVLTKPKIADDTKWSEPSTTTFHTNATIPGAPPRMDMGSFEVRNPTTEFREVFIYWQQIPRFLENGDNFEYKITSIIEHGINGPQISNVTPILITKTYAQFSSLSYNRYDFIIASSNNLGESTSSTYLSVPGKENSVAEPSHFIKSSYGHGVWELNWKLDLGVSSYTIFWCDNKQDRPYECQGYLNWTHVYVGKNISGETAIMNITLPVDKIYQLALSANTKRGSSGMVWASCTLLSGKVSSKLKNIWISKIGSDFIEVNWIFDCVRIHEGFQLHYCPIRDPEKPTCKEPEKTIAIKGNAIDSHATIRELKPYTTYSVYFASMKNVPLSKVLLNTTLEGAPDKPPRAFRHQSVTNTTITISWERPVSLNGVLRHYILHWNDNSTKIENQSSIIQFTLTNLKSYTEYDIKVQACTTACSINSSAIHINTHIGTPGPIDAPLVRFFNKTEYNMVVTWKPPQDPGGKTAMYVVRVKLSDGNNILKEKIYNTQDTKLEIPTKECQVAGGPKYYVVEVSAVNVDEQGRQLAGPWSQPGEGNCFPGPPSMFVMLAILLVALLAICISVVYGIRCAWLRCKAMQNVGVKLPPQLELHSVFKDKVSVDLQMGAHVCPPQLKQLDIKEVPPPDQQLLLDKKDKEECLESSTEDCEEGNGDQESSGCGSGHDSVSSSITAGTHITDSGTEADERPSTPDVFGDTPRRKGESRQRNVSVSGSGGEGYSRLAAAPSNNNGYVTVAPASRGYVSHPPLWSQNPSKGYVTVGPPVNLNSTCD